MPEKSMAAVVHYALKPGAVELRELPRPRNVADDEVLLQTGAVGVCGSEVHQYHNTHSWPVNVPVVLGHEFCGVVARAGGTVRRGLAGRGRDRTGRAPAGRCPSNGG